MLHVERLWKRVFEPNVRKPADLGTFSSAFSVLQGGAVARKQCLPFAFPSVSAGKEDEVHRAALKP